MTHPPEIVEDAVGWFLPPACREEVLGDLYERYANAAQYAASALIVAPRVILSHIRRNTDARVFLLTGFAICYSFAAGAPRNESWTLERLAIPTIAALLVLLFRNGYADSDGRRLRAITFDIAVAMGAAGITQLALLAALRFDLMLLEWCPSQGSALGWLFVILLRAIFPPEMRLPAAAPSPD
jgi:hypothetical protein